MSGNSNYPEITIAHIASDGVFESAANRILSTFNGKLLKQLDGIDVRYWDFEVQGELITLHQETFIGITVYPSKYEKASPKANLLVNLIGSSLAGLFL